MKAIGTRIIIRQDEPETMSGSIHLLQGKEIWNNVGTVESVGHLVTGVKPGDRVMFERKPDTALAGGWQKPDDEYYNLLSLNEENIIGILEDE